MTSEEVRKHLRANPFQPFTVHLADGRSFDVLHSEFMAVSDGGRLAAITHKRTFEVVDLLLVTSIELKPPESSAA